ncbi:ribosome maturation factor RimP [Aestuariimicrobium ganziense]|uniref:ribosome maturation factor RimP n=1 Tax=Aestuariimicrobium ganziense TaxID=2773677 RepID=UPI001941188E|nr:ribosome maturation factor RimP [Aestuariimicrobium ganziense]
MSQERIAALVEPILERHGLELDRLEVIPAGRRSVVRVTVDGDGPHGRGPLLDDIAAASQDLSQALDEADAVKADSYTLEVSSRGLSSPLTEPKHFRRNLTRLLKVTLDDGRTLEGRLLAATETTIDLEVTPESVKGNRNPKPVTHTLDMASVRKALVQVELNRSIDDDLGLGDDLLDDEDDTDNELEEN